jgi:hypothetical protein
MTVSEDGIGRACSISNRLGLHGDFFLASTEGKKKLGRPRSKYEIDVVLDGVVMT